MPSNNSALLVAMAHGGGGGGGGVIADGGPGNYTSDASDGSTVSPPLPFTNLPIHHQLSFRNSFNSSASESANRTGK